MFSTATLEQKSSSLPAGKARVSDPSGMTRHGFVKKYFQQAAIGLLCDKTIEAPMGFYLYAAPLSSRDPVRGSEFWSKAANHPCYTLLRQEEALLKDPLTAQWAKESLPYRATLMDMASGNSEKGLYMIHNMDQVERYIAIDQTKEFAQQTARNVSLKCPELETDFIVHDIIYGGIPKVSADIRNPVMILFGGLLGNGSWPLKPDVDDRQRLAVVMADVARVFKEQLPFFFNRSGKIVTTWQLCDLDDPQDFKKSIEDSYNNNPAFAQFALNGLHLIKADLKVKGLDCDAFDFRAEWMPEQMRVCFNAISKKNQNYTVEGHEGHLDAGESLTVLESFKFSREAIADIYNAAGFPQVNFFTIPGNQIALVSIDVPPISRSNGQSRSYSVTPASYGVGDERPHRYDDGKGPAFSHMIEALLNSKKDFFQPAF